MTVTRRVATTAAAVAAVLLLVLLVRSARQARIEDEQESRLAAQIARNEAGAVASLREINRAQAAYQAECGRGYYSMSLMDLATRPPGKGEAYLPSYKRGELGFSLTSSVRGSLVTIRPGEAAAIADCNGFPTQAAYYAVAVPASQGLSGIRSYATNQSGVVWVADGLPPPAEPFGPPARPVP